VPARFVVRAPRVGVDYAGQWAHAPLRFLDARSAHVSVKSSIASRRRPRARTRSTSLRRPPLRRG
jgi:hypothetical protein